MKKNKWSQLSSWSGDDMPPVCECASWGALAVQVSSPVGTVPVWRPLPSQCPWAASVLRLALCVGLQLRLRLPLSLKEKASGKGRSRMQDPTSTQEKPLAVATVPLCPSWQGHPVSLLPGPFFPKKTAKGTGTEEPQHPPLSASGQMEEFS